MKSKKSEENIKFIWMPTSLQTSDDSVVKAMVRGKTIMEYGNGRLKKDIIKIWGKIQESL